MLTFTRPFDGETSQEVLNRVLLDEPMDPRKLNHRVPMDLAVICLKALEKKPQSRYAGMKDLAEDLRRYLNGEAILAKPVGAVTKLMKRARRRPALSLVVAVAMLACTLFVLAIPWYLLKTTIARNTTLAAKEDAENYAKLAEERYEKLLLLSDLNRLSELEEEADRLWPACPELVSEMETWLKEAVDFANRIDIHVRALEELRAKAEPSPEGSGIQPAWVFESRELSWQHDELQNLVSEMQAFRHEEMGTVMQMKSRFAFAATVYEKTIEDHREEWDRAIASITNPEKCPMYKKLEITPQVGLVPIGPDPQSGLWEFAHLQTGEVPERGADGSIEYEEESGLVFVLIPGGTFNMGAMKPDPPDHPLGSPNVDPYATKHTAPVHRVDVKPFFISKYEMTHAQWQRFTIGRMRRGYWSTTPLEPVNELSWNDASLVVSRLGLRLPSEAEWEYAARAGTTTRWWTGDDPDSMQGAENIADLSFQKERPHAKYVEAWDDGYPWKAPVHLFRPNSFGLHHVVGNVCEWCQDIYHSTFDGAPGDGSPREDGSDNRRVAKGNCYFYTHKYYGIAFRFDSAPGNTWHYMGFRPARTIDP
jgi:formylglycine-generating enzyme required for sulfatase activity